MKTLITITLISAAAALYANVPSAPVPATGVTVMPSPQSDEQLAWVDEKIQAILPARVGISEGIINSLGDPMKMKRSVSAGNLLAPPKLGSTGLLLPKIVEEPLRLQALINKSALINGKWYKLSEKVRSYTLSEIKPNSVLLSGKKDQKLILFLTKQNSNIKFTTK